MIDIGPVQTHMEKESIQVVKMEIHVKINLKSSMESPIFVGQKVIQKSTIVRNKRKKTETSLGEARNIEQLNMNQFWRCS